MSPHETRGLRHNNLVCYQTPSNELGYDGATLMDGSRKTKDGLFAISRPTVRQGQLATALR
jgi:hypothetical protein